MHEASIRDEFTHQTETFARAPAMLSAEALGTIVDLVPAMIEKAREEAAREELDNTEFALGDATALAFDDASFDGVVTRFSLHHIPAPGRVLKEMARVVRPGGLVIVSDHLTDEDRALMRWRRP